MTAPAPDRPDVKVFPPVIPFTTLVTACLLQWLEPLGLIANIEMPLRIGLGVVVMVSGLITTSAGRRALARRGTNVNPSMPTTALVTDGIFGRTRNPLYVGISIALCGLAFIFDLDWMLLLLLLLLPSCLVLHFAVVRREECYLEQKFGEAYRRYRERVPRYLLGY